MPRSSRSSYDYDEDEDQGGYSGSSRSRSRSSRDYYEPRYSREEEDYPRSRRSSSRRSDYDEEEGGEEGEYGSSRHGRMRHEPIQIERQNRRRGALKGWGEDPDEAGEEDYGSRRGGRYSSSSRRSSYGEEYPRSRRRQSENY